MEELETPSQNPDPSEVAAAEPESQEPDTAGDLLPDEALPARALDDIELRAVVEAIVYVADEPLPAAQIAASLDQPADRVVAVLDLLIAEFERPEHGVGIRQVAGGYKMATKPEHHDTVRAFVKSLKLPVKLSLPALETLAVIAYKQPVTAPEVMEVRGVQGAGVLKTLLDRKLIAAAGRKNVIGKPILYKTTKEFLIQFGLKDLTELPTLKEFEEIRRMAFSDSEPAAPAEPVVAAGPSRVQAAPPAEPAVGAESSESFPGQPVPSTEAATDGEPSGQPAEPGVGAEPSSVQAATPAETMADAESSGPPAQPAVAAEPSPVHAAPLSEPAMDGEPSAPLAQPAIPAEASPVQAVAPTEPAMDVEPSALAAQPAVPAEAFPAPAVAPTEPATDVEPSAPPTQPAVPAEASPVQAVAPTEPATDVEPSAPPTQPAVPAETSPMQAVPLTEPTAEAEPSTTPQAPPEPET